MLLCSLLCSLPLLLAPLFAFLASVVPVPAPPAPAEVAEVAAEVVEVPALATLRAAVAARPGLAVLPPVADEMPILRAPRGAGGRYVAPARCYAAPALTIPSVL